VLPVTGDVVTARVEIVNQRFAKCQIICIGDTLLNRPLRGILRREDVRATDIDRIEMYKNFRPNDIILAKIIPQIEIHTYSLSTAENELGVVVAVARGLSASSNYIPVPMVPISWNEMQCPNTGVKEPRKVAKIMSENSLIKTE
jgi:exosome complex component CSL4